jgi:hypothetical protein
MDLNVHSKEEASISIHEIRGKMKENISREGKESG